jgi:LAS superfamily LD-carboxypeptidase LdcB
MALKRIQGLLRAQAPVVTAFKKVNKAFGGKLRISTPYGAYRSRAQQAKLYRLYQQGLGPTAAAPGHSNHEAGYALDLWNWAAFPKLEAVMKAHGFTRDVPGEKWHYHYTGKK